MWRQIPLLCWLAAADLGFSKNDRSQNVRRVGEVARLFADAGLVVIGSVISPYRTDRIHVRELHAAVGLPFIEVFVDTPLDVCELRDPKGLYAKARSGGISGFTGVDDPYETPQEADLVIQTVETTVEEAVSNLLEMLPT